jgi:hypothetical protein
LIAALVFVVLLITAGAVVLITRHHDTNTRPTAGPTPSAVPSSGPGTATGFALPLTDPFGRRIDVPNNRYGQVLDQTAPQHKPTDPDWLTAAPAGTHGADAHGWQQVYGATVPFSTSDGPTGLSAGAPTGYAHTPQGAALAAAYVMWETTARPADRALRERMVVMSAQDFAQFDQLEAAGKLPERAPDSVTAYMFAPDAFRIISWAPDLCVLDLATRADPDSTGTPGWLSSQLAMVWDGSGWRMRLPATRALPQESLYSLTGWTPW